MSASRQTGIRIAENGLFDIFSHQNHPGMNNSLDVAQHIRRGAVVHGNYDHAPQEASPESC